MFFPNQEIYEAVSDKNLRNALESSDVARKRREQIFSCSLRLCVLRKSIEILSERFIARKFQDGSRRCRDRDFFATRELLKNFDQINYRHRESGKIASRSAKRERESTGNPALLLV